MRTPERSSMSVAGLLAYVLFIAIGLTSLINANRLWFSVMFLTYLGSICFATVGAVLRRGSARAFWMGFALFGWAFFYYSFHDQTDRMIGNPIILLSQDASDWILHWADPDLFAAAGRPRPQPLGTPLSIQMRQIHAEKVLQTIFGMTFTTIGAFTCKAVFRVRIEDQTA